MYRPHLFRLVTGISTTLFSLLCFLCVGQTPAMATWEKNLRAAKDNVDKAHWAIALAEAFYGHDLSRGLTYAEQALALARDGGDDHTVAQALTAIGTYHSYKGNPAVAAEHYREAIAIATGQTWGDYPAQTYLRYSALHRVMANFDSSRWFIEKAEQALSGRKAGSANAFLWENKGLLANAVAHNDEALMFLRRAATANQQLGDSLRLADCWRAMGSVFKDMTANDSSFFYYDQAQAIAERLHEPVILLLLNLNRGETNFSAGRFDQAIGNYQAALNLLKDHSYKLYYGIALFKIGEVHENEGAYHIAYNYFYDALDVYESINARQEIERTYTQIGWCYVYEENYPQAMANAQNSLAIARAIGDSASIGQNENLVGYISYKNKKYDAAVISFERAISIRKKIKDWYGYSFSLYNLALTNLELRQFEKAHELFLQSIAVDERVGKKIGILFTSNTLGLQYAKEGDFAKAAHYLARANTLAKEIPVTAQLLTNYEHYIFLYEAQKNDRQVIAYYKLYTALKDSLSDEVNSSRVAKADALFQVQKKVNEVQLINKENEIQQERIFLQQREITVQRRIILVTAISLVVLAAFSIMIFRLFKFNKRSKEQLRRQNTSILEQQEEIQAQSEELQESNDKLYALNATLSEKNEEIEMQSEKLKVANDALENVNDSLEKRVEERTRELNKAYEELETFFYHTSHDFRRPLTTYLGLAEVAKATVADQHAIALFEKVRQTTVGLDNMLRKLQSISNVEYYKAFRDVAVKDVLDTVVDKFAGEIQSRKIAVSVHCSVETLLTNPFLLTVVIENLVENAVQFSSPQDPCIRIEVRAEEQHVVIDVTDNGEGIDDTLKSKIFDMYYRGSVSSKGNGLGLYIARRAIEKIGGTLSFCSVRYAGSTFTASLPLKPAHIS
jgi:signal transduction histidine kinase